MSSLLVAPPDDFTLSCLHKWEADLDRTFLPDQVQRIIQFALKSSVCTRIQENNFKLLTRSGIAPLQLCANIPLKSQIVAGGAKGHRGRFSILSFHVQDWTISGGRCKELPKSLLTIRFQRTLPFFFSIARISLLKFRRSLSFVTY